MSGIFPEVVAGGIVIRDIAGNCLNPPGVNNAYCPPVGFTTTCALTAFQSNDCNSYIVSEQVNAIVSELLCLGVELNPNGTWNCNAFCNLSNLFNDWKTGDYPGSFYSRVTEILCGYATDANPPAGSTLVGCDDDGVPFKFPLDQFGCYCPPSSGNGAPVAPPDVGESTWYVDTTSALEPKLYYWTGAIWLRAIARPWVLDSLFTTPVQPTYNVPDSLTPVQVFLQNFTIPNNSPYTIPVKITIFPRQELKAFQGDTIFSRWIVYDQSNAGGLNVGQSHSTLGVDTSAAAVTADNFIAATSLVNIPPGGRSMSVAWMVFPFNFVAGGTTPTVSKAFCTVSWHGAYAEGYN